MVTSLAHAQPGPNEIMAGCGALPARGSMHGGGRGRARGSAADAVLGVAGAGAGARAVDRSSLKAAVAPSPYE